MNRLWSFLGSLLREAKSAAQYKDDLYRYVSLRYSQHEADQVLDSMKRMSVQSFQEYIDREYLDSGMNAIVRDMISAGVSRHPDRSGKGGKPPERTPLHRAGPGGSTPATDKGSGRPDPIPTRPGRQDADSPLYSRPAVLPPGQKPTHAVGTAGQNQPRPQPSQGTGVVPQRPEPGETRSGLVQAQRIVDRLTKQGKTREADELARRLQVPTSAERIVKDAEDRPVLDQAGNPRVAVWSPDRIFRYRDVDRGPGAPAPPEQQPRNRLDLIKHGLLKRQGAGVIKPSFRGQFFGQAWQPHGRAQVKNTMRPDPATGNFAFGKSEVDPSKTGSAVVWDGDDWIPKDEFDRRYGGSDSRGVANRAWKASQHPPTRGKHVGGRPVSTTSPESIPLSRRRGEPEEEPNEFDDAPDTDPDLKPYRGG